VPAHKSRLVGEFLENLNGWIATEYLPPYAPELNPVEYLWSHWKQHELPNVCPKDFWQLSEGARRTLVSFLQGCVNGDYFWRPPDSDELLVPFVM
jgi:hypothetical protein